MPRQSKESITPEKAFAQVLREVRLERGLSQEGLGFESGYHRTYIGMLERGLMNPSVRTVFSLASALKVPPDELIRRVYAVLGPNWKRERQVRVK